jgi:TusA-related sulfurtransferase
VQLFDVPGGKGKVIGELKKGDAVTVIGTCPITNPDNPQDPNNGWCKITDTTQNKTGAVWGDFVSK